MSKRLLFSVAVLLTFSLAASARAKWTLMVYQASDNNLEEPQLNDLKEMVAAGGNAQVNVVVFCDRSDGYTNAGVANIKNWTSGKVFKVTKNRLTQLADWGETDTTDGKTLERFVAFAATKFPAEKFGLVLEDHGGGWTGGFSDETSKEEMGDLTVNEICGALRATVTKTKKLEFVGFDACLMSNIETAHALVPYAKFLVASEETEPGAGWHYTPWINALKAKPSMSTLHLGKTIVDTFFASYEKSPYLEMSSKSPMLTLAVTDLSKVSDAVRAVQSVGLSAAQELAERRENWIQYAAVRSVTEAYAVDDTGADLAMFDAATLFRNLSRREIASDASKSAAVAETKIRAAVVYARRGKARPEATGLSICVPQEPEVLSDTEGNAYSLLPFNNTPQWKTFLTALSRETVEDETAPTIGTIGLSDTTVTGNGTVNVTAQMKEASDIDQSWLFLARKNDTNDNMIVLGKMPAPFGESDKMAVDWDGKWFQLTDGDNFYICPTTHTIKNSGGLLFYVLGQVRKKGGKDWTNATLVFFLDKGSKGDAHFVYAMQKNQYGVNEVPVKLGDDVRPVYAEVLTDGEPRLIFMKDAPPLKRTPGLRVSYGNVNDGEYLIGFVAEDYSGNVSTSFTSCRIKRG